MNTHDYLLEGRNFQGTSLYMLAINKLFLKIICLDQHNHQGKDSLLQVENLHIQIILEDQCIIHEYHLDLFNLIFLPHILIGASNSSSIG